MWIATKETICNTESISEICLKREIYNVLTKEEHYYVQVKFLGGSVKHLFCEDLLAARLTVMMVFFAEETGFETIFIDEYDDFLETLSNGRYRKDNISSLIPETLSDYEWYKEFFRIFVRQ